MHFEIVPVLSLALIFTLPALRPVTTPVDEIFAMLESEIL